MLMVAPSDPPGNAGALMAGAPPFPGASQVTLANWQDPPFNRWAFQHIRELIPRAEREILGLRFRSAGRDLTVADMLAETYTDGFLVLHRGTIICEQYFNGMTPDTPHLLMSVSKSMVAAVAGILAGRGVLDVSAPVE